ncbi:transposon ty3-I gag-pol polyprotein [Tanacetum coccineum]
MHTPVLTLPDFSKAFIIQTDASGSGIGAILSQGGHLIAYFSKQMWQQQDPSEATWESLDDFHKDFPSFNLEDKVLLDVGDPIDIVFGENSISTQNHSWTAILCQKTLIHKIVPGQLGF